jgi:hypothetical protein
MNLAQKAGVPEQACNVTLTIIRKHRRAGDAG